MSVWTTILLWSGVGFLSGIISISIPLLLAEVLGLENGKQPNLDSALMLSPGIVFGVAIYLFGEYSSSPPIGKKIRLVSFIVLTIASTLGWYWAMGTFRNIGLFGSFKLEDFLIAGAKGGSIIAVAELLCWQLMSRRWLYFIIIVLTASLSGLVFYYFTTTVVGMLAVFAIWQSIVLASHILALKFTRKRQ